MNLVLFVVTLVSVFATGASYAAGYAGAPLKGGGFSYLLAALKVLPSG